MNTTQIPSALVVTPWGTAENGKEVTEGIWTIDTASHGGYWAKDDAKLAALIRDGSTLEDCWTYFLDNPPNHLDNYNVDEHMIEVQP